MRVIIRNPLKQFGLESFNSFKHFFCIREDDLVQVHVLIDFITLFFTISPVAKIKDKTKDWKHCIGLKYDFSSKKQNFPHQTKLSKYHRKENKIHQQRPDKKFLTD